MASCPKYASPLGHMDPAHISYYDTLVITTCHVMITDMLDYPRPRLLLAQGSDEGFLLKAHQAFGKHASYVKPKRGNSCTFVLKHYAADAEYSTAGWLDKNRDAMAPGVLLTARCQVGTGAFDILFDYDMMKSAVKAKPEKVFTFST